MSVSHTRAAVRRAKEERLRADFEENRKDPKALEQMLRRIARSPQRVWLLERLAEGGLSPEERYMFAEAIDPRLAGRSPARKRLEAGEGKIELTKKEKKRGVTRRYKSWRETVTPPGRWREENGHKAG